MNVTLSCQESRRWASAIGKQASFDASKMLRQVFVHIKHVSAINVNSEGASHFDEYNNDHVLAPITVAPVLNKITEKRIWRRLTAITSYLQKQRAEIIEKNVFILKISGRSSKYFATNN